MLQYSFKATNAVTNHSTHSRESEFTTRWGKSSGVERQADNSMYAVGPSAGNDLTPGVTEQVLSSYKTSGAAEARSTIMNKLTQDSMRYVAGQRGARLHSIREESAYNQAIAELVQWFYDQLEACSFEFNHAMGWTGLTVTATKPGLVNEVVRTSKMGEVLESVNHFRARFSTGAMSLVIRGNNRRVEFLILPVDKVIGLSQAEAAYRPLVTFVASSNSGNIQWQVDGKPIYQAGMEVISMWLFEQLVEMSRQESMLSEAV